MPTWITRFRATVAGLVLLLAAIVFLNGLGEFNTDIKPEVYIAPGDMLAELREDNLKLIESFRTVKQAAEDAGDNATSGIVDEWTDQAEERAWFLFEASRKG